MFLKGKCRLDKFHSRRILRESLRQQGKTCPLHLLVWKLRQGRTREKFEGLDLDKLFPFSRKFVATFRIVAHQPPRV